MLLLALHLCVFTMFGMLLFTGEKVLPSPGLLSVPARRDGGPSVRCPWGRATGEFLGQQGGGPG